ncbi:MAG: hypothetical protein MI739_14915 [Bacteroidales bacterium]|nr:hypothetical protein [Bacteroidales bacterium]
MKLVTGGADWVDIVLLAGERVLNGIYETGKKILNDKINKISSKDKFV